MKITFLMPADDLTGGNRVVAMYAQQLQQRGHDVLVMSNAPDRVSARERFRAWRAGPASPQAREVKARRAPAPGHIALSGVPHKVLERPRPFTAVDVRDGDVLIATWWETAVWMDGFPASKGRRVHLIQGYETWTGGDVRARVHAALRLPNVKVAISTSLARDIEADLGALGITVVPNAVDLDVFDAAPRERGQPPTVGFIYALTSIKGADVCIRACEVARARLPDLRVLAFGGDLPSADLPLPAGTEYHHRPAQDAIPGLYARCDAWLFGSRVDSFGLPILEAMACRTPVIGVPIGAAPELLADGAGMLVPKESPDAMAAAIVELCSGPAPEWAALSERAWTRAHAYSWGDAAERLLDVLEDDRRAS